MSRDYSSISPSARSLLYLKAITDIPFARQATELILGDKVTPPEVIDDVTFLRRLIHFESRYWSVDNLLREVGTSNIIEISSGFSFRGLSMVTAQPEIHYIDTDLPEVMELKSELTAQLIQDNEFQISDNLHLKPLNALDADAFISIANALPSGPVTIVNEGLLVYLGVAEKQQLCKVICDLLVERGGCWVTGDIYIRKDFGAYSANDRFSKFLEQHRVEENKFESFEHAEAFFAACGLKILKKAGSVINQLTSLKYVTLNAEQLAAIKSSNLKIRETWALVPDTAM